MKTIQISRRLRGLSLGVLLFIPLLLLEVVVIAQIPWWKLSFLKTPLLQTWLIVGCALFLPISLLLYKGVRGAVNLFIAILAAWTFISAVTAFLGKNTSVGFFVFLLLVSTVFFFHFLSEEFGSSYFNPNLRWYEGLPKQISGLMVRLESQEGLFSVSRFDHDGIFIFSSKNKIILSALPQQVACTLEFREEKIRVKLRPMRLFRDSKGFGAQFVTQDADHEKDLADFIERVTLSTETEWQERKV